MRDKCIYCGRLVGGAALPIFLFNCDDVPGRLLSGDELPPEAIFFTVLAFERRVVLQLWLVYGLPLVLLLDTWHYLHIRHELSKFRRTPRPPLFTADATNQSIGPPEPTLGTTPAPPQPAK